MYQVSIISADKGYSTKKIVRMMGNPRYRCVGYVEGQHTNYPFRVIYWRIHPVWTNGGDIVQFAERMGYYHFAYKAEL